MTPPSPQGLRASSRLLIGSLLGLLLWTGIGVGWRQVRWRQSLDSWQAAGVTIDWRPGWPEWDRWWASWPKLRRVSSPAVPRGLIWKPTADRVRGRELELALRSPTVTELEIPLTLLRDRTWRQWGGGAAVETLVLSGGPPGARALGTGRSGTTEWDTTSADTGEPVVDESGFRESGSQPSGSQPLGVGGSFDRELTAEDVAVLAGLPRLRQLCCRDLVLGRGSLEGLARRLSLESLELQFCEVPGEEWSGLRGATRLRRLELTGQTLPDSEWGRLQRDLPHVRIADD